jgi:hypothetical protein
MALASRVSPDCLAAGFLLLSLAIRHVLGAYAETDAVQSRNQTIHESFHPHDLCASRASAFAGRLRCPGLVIGLFFKVQSGGTWNQCKLRTFPIHQHSMEVAMGFGKGALLWLIGIPLPIILLLAIFMHH